MCRLVHPLPRVSARDGRCHRQPKSSRRYCRRDTHHLIWVNTNRSRLIETCPTDSCTHRPAAQRTGSDYARQLSGAACGYSVFSLALSTAVTVTSVISLERLFRSPEIALLCMSASDGAWGGSVGVSPPRHRCSAGIAHSRVCRDARTRQHYVRALHAAVTRSCSFRGRCRPAA